MPAKKRNGRGGARPGSGPKRKARAKLRRNRVVVLLTDGEHTKLQRVADARNLPLGTVAYELLSSALARRRK